VFSEANAAGVPSIGSTEGGSGELIGDAGRVVHPSDVDELLAAMLELAVPATARELAARASRRSRLFTWPKVGERLLRALNISNHPRPLAEFL
jgi:glycosyltransferase involved in cell wall biosynthesis